MKPTTREERDDWAAFIESEPLSGWGDDLILRLIAHVNELEFRLEKIRKERSSHLRDTPLIREID